MGICTTNRERESEREYMRDQPRHTNNSNNKFEPHEYRVRDEENATEKLHGKDCEARDVYDCRRMYVCVWCRSVSRDREREKSSERTKKCESKNVNEPSVFSVSVMEMTITTTTRTINVCSEASRSNDSLVACNHHTHARPHSLQSQMKTMKRNREEVYAYRTTTITRVQDIGYVSRIDAIGRRRRCFFFFFWRV